LLDDLYNKLGFRVGLDALANATLGKNKSADGLQAIEWFKQGRIEELIAYCRDDVAVTKALYEFGRDQGYVQFRDKFGRTKQVRVSWK